MSTIKLTAPEWKPILQRIKEEYKLQPSVFLVRTAMRRELGFTTRYHTEWVARNNNEGMYVEEIHLDFYDDNAETMFRLKYL